MARADLLLKLVTAGSSGDTKLFQRTVEALIAEERSKRHYVLAERLEESLKTKPIFKDAPTSINVDSGIQNLIYEQMPNQTLNDLILNDSIQEACRELIEEQHRSELLKSYGMEPRNRVLLVGPPGNGKTSLAEALASELMVPFFSVRYEGVIGSYLGETASRLNKVFDFVKTQRCVLFFDEFDAIGKERGDQQETGEIKRVVSSLLMQIDSLPSYVVVVTATNHPELLDRAVWRRFQLRLDLPKPNKSEIEKWFDSFSKKFDQPLGYSARTLSDKLYGLSFAEIEQFSFDVKRRYVLSLPSPNLKTIIRERLKQWEARYNITPKDLE